MSVNKFYIFFRSYWISGRYCGQMITACAENEAQARRLVAEDLKIQAGRRGDISTVPEPDFDVQELSLEHPQVLTSVFNAR